jgi:hypothetical protein
MCGCRGGRTTRTIQKACILSHFERLQGHFHSSDIPLRPYNGLDMRSASHSTTPFGRYHR